MSTKRKEQYVVHNSEYKGEHHESEKGKGKPSCLIITVVILVVSVLAIALILGLYFGLKDDDDSEVASRLETIDRNKEPDFKAQVVVKDKTWDPSMADQESSAFKTLANDIEKSMDAYYQETAMTDIYDYVVVTRLWEGSVGSDVQMYLQPPKSNTTNEMQELYLEIQKGQGTAKLAMFLRQGQENYLSRQNQDSTVEFDFDTYKKVTTEEDKTTTTEPTTTDSITITTTYNVEQSTTSKSMNMTTTSGGLDKTTLSSTTIRVDGSTTASNNISQTTSSTEKRETQMTTPGTKIETKEDYQCSDPSTFESLIRKELEESMILSCYYFRHITDHSLPKLEKCRKFLDKEVDLEQALEKTALVNCSFVEITNLVAKGLFGMQYSSDCIDLLQDLEEDPCFHSVLRHSNLSVLPLVRSIVFGDTENFCSTLDYSINYLARHSDASCSTNFSSILELIIAISPLLTEKLPFLKEKGVTEALRRYGSFENCHAAYKHPSFLVEPKDVFFLYESTASLNCLADGIPKPQYEWLKQDGDQNMKHIQPNSRIDLTDGKLSIEDFTIEDEGIYQCKAINEVGTILSSNAVVSGAALGEFSNIPPAAVTVKQYEEAILECPAIFHKPDVNYVWFTSEIQAVLDHMHLFTSANGKLYFSEVLPSDEGCYHCVVSLPNSVNFSPVSRFSLPIELRVQAAAASQNPPVIHEDFISVFKTFPESDTQTLECFASGSLPLYYSWFREGNQSLPKGHRLESFNRRLILQNLTLEDLGLYTCEVASGSGLVDRKSVVLETVKSRPKLKETLTDMQKVEGDSLTWYCEAYNQSLPITYKWYKDGVMLTNSSKLVINSNSLEIDPLDPVDSGMYQCAAENSLGVTFSNAWLKVKGLEDDSLSCGKATYIIEVVGAFVCVPKLLNTDPSLVNMSNNNEACVAIYNCMLWFMNETAGCTEKNVKDAIVDNSERVLKALKLQFSETCFLRVDEWLGKGVTISQPERVKNDSDILDVTHLALYFQLHVSSYQWDDNLKIRTSDEFEYMSDFVKTLVADILEELTGFEMTIFTMPTFERENATVLARFIAGSLSDKKSDLSTLKTKITTMMQEQEGDLDVTVENFSDALTPVLTDQEEIWVWYNGRWKPLCYSPKSQQIVYRLCRELSYSNGTMYKGLVTASAIEPCANMITPTSTQCDYESYHERCDCLVAKAKCYDEMPEFRLAGGDGTYGYVVMKMEDKEGLLDMDWPGSVTNSFCQDMNSTFGSGIQLHHDPLDGPSLQDVWQVDERCKEIDPHRPYHSHSNFALCLMSYSDFLSSRTNQTENGSTLTSPATTFQTSSIGTSNSYLTTATSQYSFKDRKFVKIQCFSKYGIGLRGNSSSFGIVYDLSSGKSLCKHSFTSVEATVACRTLGFPAGGSIVDHNPYPSNDQFESIADVSYDCLGDETNIGKCRQNHLKPGCSGPALVQCLDETVTEKEMEFKLGSDGRTALVFQDGKWGLICPAGQTLSDHVGSVICSDLGYTYGYVFSPRFYDRSIFKNFPFAIFNVTCSDTASQFADCSYSNIYDDRCKSSNPLQVACYNESATFALETTSEPRSGYVKVTREGAEGYLCSSFYNEFETVMCHTLGFKSGRAKWRTLNADPNINIQYLWQADFISRCSERDVNVELCRSSPWKGYNISQSQNEIHSPCNMSIVYLHCTGNVMLESDRGPRVGNLKIFESFEYHQVCEKSVTQTTANAVCRTIIKNDTAKAVLLPSSGGYRLRNADFSLCNASDTSDSYCGKLEDQIDDSCHESANILCYEGNDPGPAPAQATEWRVGEDDKVEVKAYGVWGTVCSDYWGENETLAFCRSLDGDYTSGVYWTDYYHDLIWLVGVQCSSKNESMNDCTKVPRSASEGCSISKIVKARCYKDETTLGLVDKKITATYVIGHMAVIEKGQPGYICDWSTLYPYGSDFWCLHMGYYGGKNYPTTAIQHKYDNFWNGTFLCRKDDNVCVFYGSIGAVISNTSQAANADNLYINSNGDKVCPLPVYLSAVMCYSTKARFEDPTQSEGKVLIFQDSTGWVPISSEGFASGDKFCSDLGYKWSTVMSVENNKAECVTSKNCSIDNTRFEDCEWISAYECDLVVYVTCLHQ